MNNKHIINEASNAYLKKSNIVFGFKIGETKNKKDEELRECRQAHLGGQLVIHSIESYSYHTRMYLNTLLKQNRFDAIKFNLKMEGDENYGI